MLKKTLTWIMIKEIFKLPISANNRGILTIKIKTDLQSKFLGKRLATVL